MYRYIYITFYTSKKVNVKKRFKEKHKKKKEKNFPSAAAIEICVKYS